MLCIKHINGLFLHCIRSFFIMIYLFILLFLGVLFGANAYIFARMAQALPALPMAVKVLIGVCMAIATCGVFLSIALRSSGLPAVLSRGLFQAGSVWLVFLLYMVLALLVVDVVAWVGLKIPYRFWVSLVLCLIVLVVGHYRYKHPKVNVVPLSFDKECTLAKPLTIVAVSDVHLGEGTGRKALARYVDLINAQHPDVIVIAGDLVDNSVGPLYRDHMAGELARLSAPHGIFMVPGNHEYISGIEAVEQFVKDTPITLLRDSMVTLPGDILLIGRDDKSNPTRASLDTLMARTDNTRPVIVLDHQPYGVTKADSLGVDLLFCGHTHRGQVWPLTWVTDHLFEQSHGYRRWTHSHVYVSQGLSLWGPPFRIGSDSEMVVFKILGK